MKICSYFIFSHFIFFLVSHECKVLSHLEIILFKKNIFFLFFNRRNFSNYFTQNFICLSMHFFQFDSSSFNYFKLIS